MILRVGKLCTLVICFAVFTSCDESTLDSEVAVISEDLLFISGEQVRLSGRLVATENQSVSDHGFLISEDESFGNPINISLGERTNPGRFIGETDGLISGVTYYWKPYSIIDGQTLEGTPKQFTTLLAEITSISPTLSTSGQFLTISGKNFTSDSRVFFDEREATVREIEKESFITVNIPPIGDTPFSEVKVVTQGNTLVAEQTFEYITGIWEQIGNFITPNSYEEILQIQAGNKFYFGLGQENNLANSKIWQLDIPSLVWTETSYSGAPILSPFYGDTYFGGGIIYPRRSENFNLNLFTLEGSDFTATAEFPFDLYKAVSIKLNGEIYVFGGIKAGEAQNYQSYKYIEAEDRWEPVKSHFIEILSDYPSFTYNGFGYFITADQVVHRYDPEMEIMETVSTFPSSVVEEGFGITEVMGDKAYIGLFGLNRSVWEYDILNNSWKQKAGLAGGSFTATVASFNYNDVVYVLKNPDTNDGMSLWTFKPDDF